MFQKTTPRCRWHLAAWLLIVTADRSADADEPSVSITETLVTEAHGNNRDGRSDNDDYADVKNRLNVGVSSGRYAGTLRLDTTNYFSPPDETYPDDARIERITFRADGDRASLTVGDFYVLFGRGLTLSLRKIDELGVDTALRGGRLDLHLPGSWETTFVAGTTNIVNIDEVNRRRVPDPSDLILGARSEVAVGTAFTFGVHGVGLRPVESTLRDEQDRFAMFGADFDFPSLPGGFSAHLEGDGQWREVAGAEPTRGRRAHLPRAFYGDLSWTRGPVTLTTELRDYRDFQPLEGSTDPLSGLRYTYTQPPTAEREDQQVPDTQNIYGGRLRADVRIPGTDHSVFANYMLSRTRERVVAAPDYELRDAAQYQHAYLGGELRLRGGTMVAQASAGLRLEQDVSSGDLLRRLLHAQADFQTPIVGPHGVHLSWIHESWSNKNPVASRARITYERGTAVVEYDYGSLAAAAFGFEYDTEVDLPNVRSLFTFGTVRYSPSQHWSLLALAGTQRGGLKCVNGVCRTFPPFSGGRLEVVYRY